MAAVVDVDCVKYACTCGLLKTLSQLYFCRYCSELRCAFCVCHEVESHFCGKCCENLPSTEARVKKNRCGNCYNCPSCHQELTTRACLKSVKPDDVKSTSMKTYYLSCLLCRWSSRDIGIPDQAAATGSWPEREHIYANRLQEVLDMYKTIVLAEKKEKELFKKKQRGKFISYTDRTGITAASLRKSLGLPEDCQFIKPKNAPVKVIPSIAHENVEELPESIFSDPINLMDITTIDQRLVLPEAQPTEITKIFPTRKMLYIKRSLRCRTCDHNVSKPEYNPSSVKFKIQLFAYYHIPEIRIVTVEPLRAGKPCELILKFTNPTQHQTTVNFNGFDSDNVIIETQTEEMENKDITSNLEPNKQMPSLSSLGSQPSSLVSLSLRTPSLPINPRPINIELNSDTTIPTSSFILPPRDDAAEYDDFNESHNIKDDPKLIVWRKSNKAFVRIIVTPKDDLDINTNVITGFTMSHLYTNTITSMVDNKEPQKFNHNVRVVLNLGNTVGSQ